MLAIATLGNSFYHKDTSMAKHLSVVPSLVNKCQWLTYLTSGLAPVPGCPDSHRQPPQNSTLNTSGLAPVLGHPGMCSSHHARQHLQPNRPETSATYQYINTSWPHHNWRVHTVNISDIPRACIFSDQTCYEVGFSSMALFISETNWSPDLLLTWCELTQHPFWIN